VKHDESVIRKTTQYISDFMRDGLEHSKGEAITYVTDRFVKEGKNVATTTIKRSVDKALDDKRKYVWLGYGAYHSRPDYFRTHNYTSYACKRICDTLNNAIREIKDCLELDILAVNKNSKDTCKYRDVIESILGSLAEHEKTTRMVIGGMTLNQNDLLTSSRKANLFDSLIEVISEPTPDNNWYNIFREIGMSNEEMQSMSLDLPELKVTQKAVEDLAEYEEMGDIPDDFSLLTPANEAPAPVFDEVQF